MRRGPAAGVDSLPGMTAPADHSSAPRAHRRTTRHHVFVQRYPVVHGGDALPGRSGPGFPLSALRAGPLGPRLPALGAARRAARAPASRSRRGARIAFGAAMDVAVTGSHGLIGTALCAALAEAGHRPIRIVRGGESSADTIAWDPRAGTIDAARLQGVDAVVNLAGAGIGDRRWTEGRKRLILESRVRGTRLLADTISTLPTRPSVFVSASAVGYYGNRGDEELTEVSMPGDDFVAHVCTEWEAATALATVSGI